MKKYPGYKIPFNKPFLAGKELEYIFESVQSGHIAGDGVFSKRCHDFLERRFRTARALLTPSCTAALEMAALLCGVQPGDEVIVPSFTFTSTVNAFLLRGARPVFVDIRPDTLNIDETLIGKKMTRRTKVIVPVHYAGVGCRMDSIMRCAREREVYVVEDAAQGVNARYKDSYLGTIGDLGAFSFHETKNYICGEGGALLINNPAFIERAEIIREKGTDRSKFFRGQVDKYTWVDAGSSYLLSDILAAFLYAQFEKMETIDGRRRRIYQSYHRALLPLQEQGLLCLPQIPEECTANYHLFYIILNDEETRDALMAYLRSRGILAVFHYMPLHLSSVGKSLGYRAGMLPVTESVSSRLLRLPFYYGLSAREQASVIESISAFFAQRKQKKEFFPAVKTLAGAVR